jgi:hypothetical protein
MTATTTDRLEGLLEASLRDFEHPPSPSLHHSALHRSEAAMTEVDEDLEDSEIASVGGYSPPAWRRLGNGDRSSGFWRGPHDVLAALPPLHEDVDFDDSEDDLILERAIRTRLPAGSKSPDKGRSPSPSRTEDRTIDAKMQNHQSPVLARPTPADMAVREVAPDNCAPRQRSTRFLL